MSQKHSLWGEIHLDAIRGCAALIVVLGHVRLLFFPALIQGAASAGGAAPHLTIGHEAVMVFFVLSGYLVGGSVLNAIDAGSWSWRHYLIRRLARLWTVLVPAVLIGAALDLFGAHLFAGQGSLYDAPAGQDFVTALSLASAQDPRVIAGNILFLQTIFVPTIGTNVPLWSLSNEFWYYLLFPAALLALRAGSGWPRRLLLGVAGFAILFMIGPDADYRFLPWLMGAAVSRLPGRISGWWAAILAGLFAATFLATKIYVADMHRGELIVAFAAAALIYAVRGLKTPAKAGIYSTAAGFLSRISYTLYLTHLPFLILLCALLNTPWTVWPVTLPSLVKLFGVLLAVLVWASGLYLLFERHTDRVRAALRRLLFVEPFKRFNEGPLSAAPLQPLDEAPETGGGDDAEICGLHDGSRMRGDGLGG